MTYYQAKRREVMLCYPFEEKRLNKWGGLAIVQPKLDGKRCRAVWEPEIGWTLRSSQDNIIMSVPHIEIALNRTFPLGGLELDGELYSHGDSFEDISSITSRTTELHPDFAKIKFYVFDIVDEAPQIARLKNLSDLRLEDSSDVFSTVEWHTALGVKQVMKQYQEILSKGYEGIIVRNLTAPYVRKRSTMIMKFKPKQSDWYKIVGWQEEISIEGLPKGRLGAFICSSQEGEEFNVGTGFTHQQRIDLWKDKEELIGRWLHVEYQHITPGRGVPRFPVFMRVVEDFSGEEG